MFFLIVNLIILILSFIHIIRCYLFIKNDNNDLESRISKYTFGSITLLLYGTFIIITSLIGSIKYDVNIKTYLIILFCIFALLVYIFLIYLWNKMYSLIANKFEKKIAKYNFKLKSITIYGLVYAFAILIYLMYFVVIVTN